MSKIFFTADQHFGHKNIIKYCNRPFSSVEEMNKVMIDRWNEIVGKEDTVYVW
jgi:calcineurin-like phosphoesterase family protein